MQRSVSLSPLTKFWIARWTGLSGSLFIPLFRFILLPDIGLLIGALAFLAWNSATLWYIERNRWLPPSTRATWARLAWMYGIKRKPMEVTINHSGVANFGKDAGGVVFKTDIGVSDRGLYINVRYLGRLWVRWSKELVLHRANIATPDGWQPALALSSPEVAGELIFQWDRKLDDVAPRHVAFYEK